MRWRLLAEAWRRSPRLQRKLTWFVLGTTAALFTLAAPNPWLRMVLVFISGAYLLRFMVASWADAARLRVLRVLAAEKARHHAKLEAARRQDDPWRAEVHRRAYARASRRHDEILDEVCGRPSS